MNNSTKSLLAIILISSILVKAVDETYITATGSAYNNPLVNNLEATFNGLSTLPYLFYAKVDDVVTDYRYVLSAESPIDPQTMMATHFQGLNRLPKHLGLDGYLIVSGSNLIDMRSEIYTLKEKDLETSTWKFKQETTLDTQGYWHAGGIQVAGKYLAIPLEASDFATFWHSKVVFYDISNPLDPIKIDVEIQRPGVSGGSVALTRLVDGHFLVAVWSDAGPEGYQSKFDFYRSIDTTLEGGFTHIAAINKSDVAYQAIQFILDENAVPYIIGTENDGMLGLAGTNHADLYQVVYSNNTVTDVVTKGSKPQLCSISNFGAGAGVSIPDCDTIEIISCSHFILTKDTSTEKFTEPTKLCFDKFGPAVFF